MSKKSKHGDGSHGKGTKGMKHEEFARMFQTPVPEKKEEKPADANANESAS